MSGYFSPRLVEIVHEKLAPLVIFGANNSVTYAFGETKNIRDRSVTILIRSNPLEISVYAGAQPLQSVKTNEEHFMSSVQGLIPT